MQRLARQVVRRLGRRRATRWLARAIGGATQKVVRGAGRRWWWSTALVVLSRRSGS
jgi:hypothetical protein